eukprot:764072-Hanusia_phi.AAC.2
MPEESITEATDSNEDREENIVVFRRLLRQLPRDVLVKEIEEWAAENGNVLSNLRSKLHEEEAEQPVKQQENRFPIRDGILDALRRRNAVVADICFDVIAKPLEKSTVRSEDALTDRAWRQFLRSEMSSLLRCGYLREVSKQRRGRLWQLCARTSLLREDAGEQYYKNLCEMRMEEHADVASEIGRDLGRSMPDIPYIASPEGQDRLRKCLLAYSAHNKELGYCQGMNFIAALLLLHIDDDEDTFWTLHSVVTQVIPGGLTRTLTSFKISVLVLCDLLKTLAPDIYLELEGLEIVVSELLGMVCPQWFISLFVNALPLPLVMKLWDIIFLEGSVAIFQIGIAILYTYSKHLQETEQPFPTMAPDYVARLMSFCKRINESGQREILDKRKDLARSLTLDKVDSVWSPNEARVNEEIRREREERELLASIRREEYQVASYILVSLTHTAHRLRNLYHFTTRCPQIVQLMQKASRVAETQIQRLTVYIKGVQDANSSPRAEPFVPSIILEQHIGYDASQLADKRLSWTEEEIIVETCIFDVSKLVSKLQTFESRFCSESGQEDYSAMLSLRSRGSLGELQEALKKLASALRASLREVPSARYSIRVLSQALPGALAIEPLYHARESTEAEVMPGDWSGLVRCLLTIRRLRAENELCGLKTSQGTKRELDEAEMHVVNKLQAHFGRSNSAAVIDGVERCLQDWHLNPDEALFAHHLPFSRSNSSPPSHSHVIIVLGRNLDVILGLLRFLPRLKNLHQAYATTLSHLRNAQLRVTTTVQEAEVRRRVDAILQVLTEVKGKLHPPKEEASSLVSADDVSKSNIPSSTASDTLLVQILLQLHLTEWLCLSLPSPWLKLQVAPLSLPLSLFPCILTSSTFHCTSLCLTFHPCRLLSSSLVKLSLWQSDLDAYRNKARSIAQQHEGSTREEYSSGIYLVSSQERSMSLHLRGWSTPAKASSQEQKLGNQCVVLCCVVRNRML